MKDKRMIKELTSKTKRPAVALDFDGTWTLNPPMWINIVNVLTLAGFDVWIVTMRAPGGEAEKEVRDAIAGTKVVDCIFTSLKAKRLFVHREYPGLDFSVWIDDNPFWILNDGFGDDADPDYTTGD